MCTFVSKHIKSFVYIECTHYITLYISVETMLLGTEGFSVDSMKLNLVSLHTPLQNLTSWRSFQSQSIHRIHKI